MLNMISAKAEKGGDSDTFKILNYIANLLKIIVKKKLNINIPKNTLEIILEAASKKAEESNSYIGQDGHSQNLISSFNYFLVVIRDKKLQIEIPKNLPARLLNIVSTKAEKVNDGSSFHTMLAIDNFLTLIKKNNLDVNIPKNFLRELLNILSKKAQRGDDGDVRFTICYMNLLLESIFEKNFDIDVPNRFLEEILQIVLQKEKIKKTEGIDHLSYFHSSLYHLIETLEKNNVKTIISYKVGLDIYNIVESSGYLDSEINLLDKLKNLVIEIKPESNITLGTVMNDIKPNPNLEWDTMFNDSRRKLNEEIGSKVLEGASYLFSGFFSSPNEKK